MITAGIIFKTVLGFLFDNPLGKFVAAGVLLAGTFSVWLWQHDNKVEAKTIAKIERQADVKAKRANKARDSVAGVPTERLRDAYLRDE